MSFFLPDLSIQSVHSYRQLNSFLNYFIHLPVCLRRIPLKLKSLRIASPFSNQYIINLFPGYQHQQFVPTRLPDSPQLQLQCPCGCHNIQQTAWVTSHAICQCYRTCTQQAHCKLLGPLTGYSVASSWTLFDWFVRICIRSNSDYS